MSVTISVDRLAALIQPASEGELARQVASLAAGLDFDHFVVGVQVSHPFAPPRQHITNGYPAAWRQRYDVSNYIAVDPTVRHCLTQSTPLIWSERLFAGAARPMWEEARAHGLSHGVSLPVQDRMGVTSMLSLARDRALRMSDAQQRRFLQAAQLFAACVHFGTSRLIVPQLQQSLAPNLTARELECLKWAAAGKTAWETAHILKIAERTAIFHLSNLVRKLGVTNRMQAVVVGVSLGLI